MIAALFVHSGGSYWNVPDVDPWDESRDARDYVGPFPVVAHPPCSRWCRLAGLVEARWGHARGDDGGCFASALRSVRRWGGVLEHPAYSAAWAAHDLTPPPTGGRWVNADFVGGWTCYVEQGRYGHVAKKATWLYANRADLPSLKWGVMPDAQSKALVSWCGNHVKSGESRPRVGKTEASKTPIEFRGRTPGYGALRSRSRGGVMNDSSEMISQRKQVEQCVTSRSVARDRPEVNMTGFPLAHSAQHMRAREKCVELPTCARVAGWDPNWVPREPNLTFGVHDGRLVEPRLPKTRAVRGTSPASIACTFGSERVMGDVMDENGARIRCGSVGQRPGTQCARFAVGFAVSIVGPAPLCARHLDEECGEEGGS